jgi:hypothetical protein
MTICAGKSVSTPPIHVRGISGLVNGLPKKVGCHTEPVMNMPFVCCAANGQVNPDSFTHGPSEQRYQRFLPGFTSGSISDRNTFPNKCGSVCESNQRTNTSGSRYRAGAWSAGCAIYLHSCKAACSFRMVAHSCMILCRHAGDGKLAFAWYSRRCFISRMSASRTTAKSPSSSRWYNCSTTASGLAIKDS